MPEGLHHRRRPQRPAHRQVGKGAFSPVTIPSTSARPPEGRCARAQRPHNGRVRRQIIVHLGLSAASRGPTWPDGGASRTAGYDVRARASPSTLLRFPESPAVNLAAAQTCRDGGARDRRRDRDEVNTAPPAPAALTPTKGP